MKKIIWFLLILFCNISSILAINDIYIYRIDMTVLTNGDIEVLEAFAIDGIYNGFEREMIYKGNFSSYYGNLFSSVNNKLYDASEIILNEVRGIDFDFEKTFLDFSSNGDLFTKTNNASKGEYGVYKINEIDNKNTFVIYNPNMMNKDFYLDYKIKNVVILHKDVSEVGINLFSNLSKNISKLELYIHVPNNQDILQAWIHGTVAQKIEKLDEETLYIELEDLKENSNLDLRFIFDNDVIFRSSKMTKEKVYDTILEKEENLLKEFLNREEEYKELKEQAYISVEQAENSKNRSNYDIAYNKVQELKDSDELKTQLLLRLMNLETKIERNETIKKIIYTSVDTIWLLGLFILFYWIYQKFDWSFHSVFKDKYNVNPPKYDPSSLGYLFHQNITDKDLIANILDMINRDVIVFEKKKKDYILKKGNTSPTALDERMIKLLFKNKEKITLTEISHLARDDYEYFITQYSNWLNKANTKALEEKFYEDLLFPKMVGILYCAIGAIIGVIILEQKTYYSSYYVIIISLMALVYFLLFKKKTQRGTREYFNGRSLKNFLVNYNSLSGVDITKVPNYIPYAISLGCINQFLREIDLKLMDKDNKKEVKEYIAFYKVLASFIPRVLKGAYLEKNINN